MNKSDHVKAPSNERLKVLNSKIALDHKKVDLGVLGKFWGDSVSSPNNIAALTICILLVIGSIYTILFSLLDKAPVLTVKDFWGIITPLITLTLGFVFGGKVKGENNEG